MKQGQRIYLNSANLSSIIVSIIIEEYLGIFKKYNSYSAHLLCIKLYHIHIGWIHQRPGKIMTNIKSLQQASSQYSALWLQYSLYMSQGRCKNVEQWIGWKILMLGDMWTCQFDEVVTIYYPHVLGSLQSNEPWMN